MDFLTTFRIIGSGLSAQRKKMDALTANIANISTTSTPEGGPYRRQKIAFAAEPLEKGFDSSLAQAVNAVRAEPAADAREDFKRIYDPAHPDADGEGFVTFPNVNLLEEMTEMITAGRAYEANATAFDAMKNMALKAMDIGK